MLGHDDDLSKPATPNQFGKRRIDAKWEIEHKSETVRIRLWGTRGVYEMGCNLGSS
jgi:hypothetical protein